MVRQCSSLLLRKFVFINSSTNCSSRHRAQIGEYGGEFYARSILQDGGPVCTECVHEKMDGEFVDVRDSLDWFHDEDEIVISCPWHGWTYNLETGTHLVADDIQFPTYDVEIDDGIVYLVPD